MGSLRQLQAWCQDVCAGYAGVQVTDMRSSFSDGLAFCAIIHRHRPDLIDFHSLSRQDVKENMRLAFTVAERDLGVPALLDPDELACVEDPDVLSIITYVSRLHSVFSVNSTDAPTTESSGPAEHTPLFSGSCVVRSSVCSVCHSHVHLIQRVLVKGRMFHRSCFRCGLCRRSLLPDFYTEEGDSLRCSYRCSNRSVSSPDPCSSDQDGSALSSADTSLCEQKPEMNGQDGDCERPQPPKPAPRRRAEPQECPRPAPRARDSRPEDAHSGQREHPWMGLVKPGPWRRLAPAPPPMPPTPSSTIPALSHLTQRRWATPDNPFLEESSGTSDVSCDEDLQEAPPISPENPFYTLDITQHSADEVQAGDSSPQGAPPPRTCEDKKEATTSSSSSSPSVSHRVSRQNPFNSGDSHTSAYSSRRSAAPGHGFPLIKRKVLTEQSVCEERVCVEQQELEERLLELEKRGVELERVMRSSSRGVQQETLLDWFTLVNEKHMLVRRDAELVYLVKQQRLEEQQADVEYELRCLLNKPEHVWSQDDRLQERHLMSQLLSIIQQRNDIVSSLDLDRQREEEEDEMLATLVQRGEVQSEIKKCGRKFKGLHIFRLKTERRKKSS